MRTSVDEVAVSLGPGVLSSGVLSPGRRVRAGVAASVLVLVALAGCANAEPGVAAYVDGTKITDRELTAAVEGVTSTLEEGQQVSTPAVLNAMIHGAIAEQLAAKDNIVITDTQRDTVLKDSNLANLVNVPAARPIAYDVADQQIVSTKLGAQAYLAAVEQKRVTLNPRFGVLDPKQKLIVSDQSGGLANPAITPTPAVPQ
jgi:hypothetical protein